MPIASPEVYAEMLDRAKAGGFAYPAINCTSSQTINAALRGFAEAESDGIIQVSWGGANFASGTTINNMVDGAIALAEFAKVAAKNYPVNVALHTDHCPPDKLDGYMRPLLQLEIERVNNGEQPWFQSHMWDGSGAELEEIHETLTYGVIKMNIDTDTQYAFTRPVADHMFKNYDGVLKIDGEVGNKKVYDPRSYGKSAEAGMAARVVEGCQDLKSAGQKMR